MVESRHPVFGLDRSGATICLAEVVIDAGRERIMSLRETASEEISRMHSQNSSRLVVAIPDRATIVKRLSIPKSLSISVNDYSRFEMEQSLLDSPVEFCMDHHHRDGDTSVLGFAARRDHLSETLHSYGIDKSASPHPEYSCRPRALALGLGFLAFYVGQPGRVTGLADICESYVSLCLLHDRRLSMVSHLGTHSYDPHSFDGRRRLAIELKTVFNYLTESARTAEVSQPLSHLLLSGPALTADLEEVIRSYFPGSVSRPKINAGFLANPGEIDNIMAERYLVALGLTVE